MERERERERERREGRDEKGKDTPLCPTKRIH